MTQIHKSLLSRISLIAVAWCSLGGAVPTRAEENRLERERIERALNRLTLGARAGDVDRVLEMGLERWIDLQLHPERIPDPGIGERLARYSTLERSPSEMMREDRGERQVLRQAREKMSAAGEELSEEQMRARMRRDMGRTPPLRRVIVMEMQAAKLTRAIYSERQLEELLVDFWFNHFNVFAGKNQLRYAIPEYEREVIRPHALGRFEDLLLATAKSPAMLFYLDNWLSVDPDAAEQQGQRRRRPGAPAPAARMRQGLNENYARELLELHTLGVDAGYTQQDVTELARVLTGWTLRGVRRGEQLQFFFDERMHDRGDKQLLGERVRGGGIDEGEAVIRRLARHPATAHFITGKLVRRFVADEAPAALVERAARTFRDTGGDIREVLRTIFSAPEFYAEDYRAAKFKNPFEFVASAARAASVEVRDARPLARRVAEMGMPLYLSSPPTGYDDVAEAWVSTNGLVSRLNFSVALTSGTIRGVRVDPSRWSGAGDASLDLTQELAGTFLPAARVSEKTLATIRDEANDDARRVASLLIGSPEFQKAVTMYERRFFLKSSALAAVSFGAAPRALLRAVYAAGQVPGKVLVVLFQRGACDALNTVIPFGEKHYRKYRPSIAIDPPGRGEGRSLDLDGRFAFHPALDALLPLYRAGSLAVVHAVGSPHGTRSHFDAQDFMETGTPGIKSTRDGWMNRYLATTPSDAGSPLRAVAMAPQLPVSLSGSEPSLAMTSIEEFGFRGRRGADAESSFAALYAQTPDQALRSASATTSAAIDLLRKLPPTSSTTAARYPGPRQGRALQDVARLVKADVGLEVAFVPVGSWDHHANEGGAEGALANQLRNLGGALSAFARDLGDRMEQVVVLTMTEFGRTARENGNRGTDHGHGSVSLVMGGGVRGGRVFGDWPGIEPEQLYQGRDLAITTDYRDLVGEVLTAHSGAPDLKRVFPGHSPGKSLGLFSV